MPLNSTVDVDDANGVLVTVLAVTIAVIISIFATVMCVDEVKKSKKKKRVQSTHSIGTEQQPRSTTADPAPASAAPPSTYIDISIVDTKQPINNTSPLPSPSVTSVQSNLSIRSLDPQPLSNDITNDFAVRKYVPIKAQPKFLRALSKTSFSTSLETMDLSPRTYLNRYSLTLGPKARMSIDATEITYIKQIGGGNFGQVYLAKWQATKVAVKTTKENASTQFHKELNLMMHLTPHPNIVQVLGFTLNEARPSIVMEYCAGGSLASQIKDPQVTFPIARTVRILFGVARGMLHLHKSNIVHRDLAARNVLLTKDGEPKLSDFGFSRLLKTTRGRSRDSIGPLFWMSPEVIRTGFFTKKLDVWSFGCVIYELVARKEPFEGQDLLATGFRIRDENLTPSLDDLTCDSSVLMTLMKECWSIDPDARPDFQTICDVLEKELSVYEPESYSPVQSVASLYRSTQLP